MLRHTGPRARRAGVVLAVGVVVAALLGGCSSAGSTRPAAGHVPRGFVGIQAPIASAASASGRAARYRSMADTRSGVVRQFVAWAEVEPSPGRYAFAGLDRDVEAAARARLQVLPVMLVTPLWASPARARTAAAPGSFPPSDPATLARFARALVERYGPRGELWREHPRLPKVPIRAWQVWNEPNLPQYWGGHPDARAYVALLRATGRAIHRADPGAEVVSAGIPNSEQGVPFTRWMAEFFAAGGRGTFDVFGLHAYAPQVDGVVAAASQARALLKRHGEARAPIWITEFGWADRGPPSPFTLSSRTQAFNVGASLQALAARRSTLGLRGFVYFAWRDSAARAQAHRGWGNYTGLTALDGAEKPSFRSFARAATTIERR